MWVIFAIGVLLASFASLTIFYTWKLVEQNQYFKAIKICTAFLLFVTLTLTLGFILHRRWNPSQPPQLEVKKRIGRREGVNLNSKRVFVSVMAKNSRDPMYKQEPRSATEEFMWARKVRQAQHACEVALNDHYSQVTGNNASSL